MSVFNPDTQASEGRDFVNASQGIPANRGFEALFSGLGNAVDAGVKTANTKVLNNIQSDVYKAVDATDDAYGINDMAEVGNAATAKGQRPQALDDRINHLQLLGQAFQSGKLSESHYWGRLTTAVKELRAKYPGYREDIDRIVAQSTGVDPANALRNTLFNEWQSQESESRSARNKMETLVFQNLDVLPPGMANAWRSGSVSDEEVISAISTRKRRQADMSDIGAQMDRAIKEGILNEQDAQSGATQILENVSHNMFEDASSPTGKIYASINNMMKQFQDGHNPTAQEDAQIRIGLNALEQQYKMQIENALNQPLRPGSTETFRSALRGKDKEVVENAMRKFNIFKDAVLNGDIGVLATQKNYIGAQSSQLGRKLLDGEKVVQLATGLRAAGTGDQFTAFIIGQNEVWSSVVKSLQGGAIGSILSGEPTPLKDTSEELNKAKAPGDAHTYNLQNTLDVITNTASGGNGTSIQSAEAAAESVYGAKNADFLNLFNERSKGGANVRLQLFNQMYSPQVTQAMQKLSAQNPNMWKMYRGSAIDKWSTLFKPQSDELKKWMGTEGSKVVYNGETGQFEMQMSESLASPFDANAAGLNYNEQAAIASTLSEINSYLRSLNPILDAGKEDKSVTVKQLFQSMGIPVETGDLPSDEENPDAKPKQESGINPDDILLASLKTSEPSGDMSGNPFLDFVADAEGTQRGRGYNETLAYGDFTGGDVDLVNMTLDEVDQLQSKMLRHPDNFYNSSAVGRYQIVQKTLRALRNKLGLTGEEKYDAQLQDQLALELARGRGASASGLRNEWEGLRRRRKDDILTAYASLE